MNGNTITNLGAAVADTDALNRITADGRYYFATTTLDSIATATGSVNLGGHNITNLLDPINSTDAVTKQYVDDNFYTQTSADNRYYLNTTTLDNISTPTGALFMNSQRITHVADAVDPTDALNKQTGDAAYYANTVTLNNITAPTGDVSLNTHHITSLATP